MNILILGAAGFIGTNLTIKLAQDQNNTLYLFDQETADYSSILDMGYYNIKIIRGCFNDSYDFESLTKDIDIVYHLISTTYPSNSNKMIASEIHANVIVTIQLLDACVLNNVGKIVFISSGGTVYGTENKMPLKEVSSTYPISSYGIQKIVIEKMLYLYNYLYNLDYRILRIANPYGPYQKPNGVLGAVTTFTYKALMKESIQVYGDGLVIRDFIFIDDVINGILNVVNSECRYKTYNIGSGIGHSLIDIIVAIEKVLDTQVDIQYLEGRKVDVPKNVLDIFRYENEFGKLYTISLEDGIAKTAEFMRSVYKEICYG